MLFREPPVLLITSSEWECQTLCSTAQVCSVSVSWSLWPIGRLWFVTDSDPVQSCQHSPMMSSGGLVFFQNMLCHLLRQPLFFPTYMKHMAIKYKLLVQPWLWFDLTSFLTNLTYYCQKPCQLLLLVVFNSYFCMVQYSYNVLHEIFNTQILWVHITD